MKKFTTILSLFLIAALVAPAMATEVTFDGHLRSRGFWYSNQYFNDQIATSDAKYDSRFRLNFKIAPTEDVFVRGRLEQSMNYGTGGYGALNLDRAWITWRTKMGSLEVGRMSGASWGLTWGDFEDAYDRIKFTAPVGDKLKVIAIIQKGSEGDHQAQGPWPVSGAAGNTGDGDSDQYYLAVNYAGENLSTGLLGAFSRTSTPAVSVANKYVLVPYVKAGLMDGKMNLLAELEYDFGEVDVLAPGATDPSISAFMAMIELNGNVNAFGWEVGYSYVQGQDDSTDITTPNTSYYGLGGDWDKFVYFTDTMGNALLTGDAYNKAGLNVRDGGVSIWWLGVSYAVQENLKLSLLGGQAMALETPAAAGWTDDNYGTEIDFKLAYGITDNLDYNFNFGYVLVGDAMLNVLGTPTANGEDAFKMMHKLQLNF